MGEGDLVKVRWDNDLQNGRLDRFGKDTYTQDQRKIYESLASHRRGSKVVSRVMPRCFSLSGVCGTVTSIAGLTNAAQPFR